MKYNQYIFSKYLHYKRKNDWIAIFHELHPNPIYVKFNDWSKYYANIEIIPNKLKKKFIKEKLIINNKIIDKIELTNSKNLFNKKLNQPIILYLILSENCNFKCLYCPVPEIKINNDIMNFEIAKLGIKLWFNHIKDKYCENNEYFLIFYGGEPLLNIDCLKKSVNFIKKLKISKGWPKKLRIMIDTNGALINDDILKFIKDNNLKVTIGIDGKKEVNNNYRLNDEGKGTFVEIDKSLKKLVNYKIKTFASVSITPKNINLISNYANFFKKIGIKKFGFNFLKGSLIKKIVRDHDLTKYYNKAANEVVKNFIKQKNYKYEFQMEKKYISFFKKDYFPIDCTCYGNQLVILPNGDISNCPFLRKRIGNIKRININKFKIWDSNYIKKLHSRFPLYNKKMKNFSEKSIYGGGCAWNSFELNDNLLANDEASLIFTKKVFNYFIWNGLSK